MKVTEMDDISNGDLVTIHTGARMPCCGDEFPNGKGDIFEVLHKELPYLVLKPVWTQLGVSPKETNMPPRWSLDTRNGCRVAKISPDYCKALGYDPKATPVPKECNPFGGMPPGAVIMFGAPKSVRKKNPKNPKD